MVPADPSLLSVREVMVGGGSLVGGQRVGRASVSQNSVGCGAPGVVEGDE